MKLLIVDSDPMRWANRLLNNNDKAIDILSRVSSGVPGHSRQTSDWEYPNIPEV